MVVYFIEIALFIACKKLVFPALQSKFSGFFEKNYGKWNKTFSQSPNVLNLETLCLGKLFKILQLWAYT